MKSNDCIILKKGINTGEKINELVVYPKLTFNTSCFLICA